jgi:hypothetical protein
MPQKVKCFIWIDAAWATLIGLPDGMHVEVRNTALATASYSIVADTVDPYVYKRR